MKRLLALLIRNALLLALVAAIPCLADFYIAKDCANNGDGSSWSCAGDPGGAGAFNILPETGGCLSGGYTWTRGVTYWLAGSDTAYGSTCFRKETGSGRLTLQKASAASHGTETGWVASYGTKQAVITNMLVLIADVTISGAYRTTAESGHGIKVEAASTVSLIDTYNNWPTTGAILEYLEMTHAGSFGEDAANAISFYGDGSNTFRYLYIHDISGLCYKSNIDGSNNTYGGLHNSTIEESVCGNIGRTTGDGHCELLKDDGEAANLVIKNNLWYDWRSTGGIVLSGGEVGWKIYNNIFEQRTASITCGNGVITGLSAGANYADNLVYSNTFVNISTLCSNVFGSSFGDFSDGGNEVKNNLFYNVATVADVCSGTGCAKGTNWYAVTAKYTPSGTEIDGGSTDPLVDSDGSNYHLSGVAGPVGAGSNLGSPYNVDFDAVARPAEGGWDIGAYQYEADEEDTTDPVVTITSPTSSATYLTTSSTINLSGTASDAVGVTSITWANDRGGSGTAIGTTSWSVYGVILARGVNVITITASDAATNTGTDSVSMTAKRRLFWFVR